MNEIPAAVTSRIRHLLPRRVRAHRILRGPLKGHKLVTSWYDYPAALLGYTERDLLDWFHGHVRNGETWVDVGAHYGYTALALSQLVGPTGRVFAFEPIVATAGHLDSTRRLNDLSQLQVVPLALGPPGEVEFRRVSLVRGMADHVSHGGRSASNHMAANHILAIAFDDVWPSIAGGESRISGVKIDVQGMEIEVLRGMAKSLLLSRPVLLLEFHEGVDRAALLKLLAELGYSGHGEAISTVSRRDHLYLDGCSYCFWPEPLL